MFTVVIISILVSRSLQYGQLRSCLATSTCLNDSSHFPTRLIESPWPRLPGDYSVQVGPNYARFIRLAWEGSMTLQGFPVLFRAASAISLRYFHFFVL